MCNNQLFSVRSYLDTCHERFSHWIILYEHLIDYMHGNSYFLGEVLKYKIQGSTKVAHYDHDSGLSTIKACIINT